MEAPDWTAGPWTNAGGDADFELYLGGVATKLHGITVGGTAWAPILENCGIGGDAYYKSSFSCTMTGGGTQYPNSDSAVPATMPISDAQIRAWEAAATSAGVHAGDVTIAKSTTVTLGPGQAYGEIDGNLTVNGTLKLTGPVWVKGNISGGVGSTIQVDSSTGNNGAELIADVPGSEATLGTVNLLNNMNLAGNGNTGSNLMILSTNSGGSSIQIANNANTVILYAPNGTIQVSNNSSMFQVTANELVLSQNVQVIYLAGLQSEHFSSGPGGSWVFLPGTFSLTQ